MKRVTSICFGILLATNALFASDVADSARGAVANTPSTSSNIDHVNLFNGNLTITIPLPTFPLNGGGSYGPHLVYNGMPWDFVRDGNNTFEQMPNRRSNAGLGWRVTLGRIILPGDPTNPTKVENGGDCSSDPDCSGYAYESVDGSDHVFYKKMHPNDTTVTGVYYTRDNTFLRLNINSGLQLEFADGSKHQFNSDGTLSKIMTPFDVSPNASVTVNYHDNTGNVCADSAATSCWELADNVGRHQWITFTATSALMTGILLHKIVLTAFNNTSATYSATYNSGGGDTSVWTDTNCGYTKSTLTPATYTVPILTGVSMPESLSYAFTIYNVNPSGGVEACSQASLQTVTLPTLGKIKYTYTDYQTIYSERDETTPTLAGVATRKMLNKSDSVIATWTYQPSIGDTSPPPLPGHTCSTCNSPRDRVVTVTTPENDVFTYYFSLARFATYTDSTDSGPWVPREYGLPLTHRNGTSNTTNGVKRFLSTEVTPSGGSVTRRRYVTYELDHNGGALGHRMLDDDRRLQSALTVYLDDSNNYTLAQSSDYDGLGHYRTTTNSGTVGGTSRITTTNFNTRDSDADPAGLPNVGTYDATSTPPGNGFTMLGTDDPWVLNTYASTATTEDRGSGNLQQSKTITCFNQSTGALLRRRALTGTYSTSLGFYSATAVSDSDLVQRFTYDSSGNLTREEFFGGDSAATEQGLPSRSVDTNHPLCTSGTSGFAFGTATYELDHSYDAGVRRRSHYSDPSNSSTVGYNILDHTSSGGGSGIDFNTGLVHFTKDSAGVLTTNTYDGLQRLTASTKASDCSTQPCPATATYTYSNATSSAAATLNITRGSSQQEVAYDDFGRVNIEKKLLPNGTWTSRTTTYKGSGWPDTVSVWGDNCPRCTTYSGYDPFGRATNIQAPDGKLTALAYVGIHTVTKALKIAMTDGQPRTMTDSTTRETYDAFGRLVEVEEPGASTGLVSSPNSIATYTYDVGNRLAAVAMTDATAQSNPITQNRTFIYDGRGFLRRELHPENNSNITLYDAYDARGHVGTKRKSSGASAYDLDYYYDTSERLVRLDAHIPSGSSFAWNKIKEFTFANSNGVDDDGNTSYVQGKLSSAVRHNFPLGSFDSADKRIDVTETYFYADAAGHLTAKTTTLTQVDTATNSTTPLKTIKQGVTYNALENEATIKYPQCEYCGAATTNTVSLSYSNGFLSDLTDSANHHLGQIAYAGNLTPSSVTHGDSAASADNATITDAYTPDSSGLPRPARIQFGSSGACTPPQATLPNANVTTGHQATLTASPTGTSPFTYQWYQSTNGQVGAIISGQTQASYTTPTLTTTHSYFVHVTNACGSLFVQGTATVVVPAPSGLNAQSVMTPSTASVHITFSQSSEGADHYELQRKAPGSGYQTISNVAATANSCDDISPSRDVTYLYQLVAVNVSGVSSSPTNSDFTTTTYFPPFTGQDAYVRADHMSQLATAVNAMRAAAGLAAFQWSPCASPDAGSLIRACHVTTLRSALDQARSILGASQISYTDPQITAGSTTVKAAHISELRGGTQ